MDTFYQILLEAIKLALAGIAGGLIGARANDKFARKRDLDSDIRRERMNFIPALKDAIVDCDGTGQPIPQPAISWQQRGGGIKACADRFSTLLGDERKRAFDAAWQKCRDTNNMELLNKDGGCFLDGQESELKAAQKLITSRLQAVLDCVERA